MAIVFPPYAPDASTDYVDEQIDDLREYVDDTRLTDADVADLVDSLSSETRLAIGRLFSSSANAALGSRSVAIGDSITIGAESHTTANESVSGSWPAYAGWESGQKLRFVKNAGVGGDTTTMMLARFATDVAPFAPTMVFIMGGTNDIGQNVAFAVFEANIVALVARTREVGARPALASIPPSNFADRQLRISTWNVWLRAYALAEGIPYIDFYTLLANPINGQYKTTYSSGDGIHPSPAGYAAMGTYAADLLSPLLGMSYTPLPSWNTEPANLLTNDLFLTDVGGDGLADTWGKYGTGTWTTTLAAADVGNWQQWNISAGATTGVTKDLAGIASPGDRVRFVGAFKTTGGFSAQCSVKGTTYYYRAVSALTDAREGVWDVEFTVPALGTGLLMIASGGVGDHGIARAGLFNLTRLGIA